MNKLSNTGKKVARRSFAAFMAAILCSTALGTNFWGFGSQESSSIVGNFNAFAADSVTYGPDEHYYDAGTLVMNAYYDSSTGTKLSESSGNYHATDWDVVKASSYVSGAVQEGNKGVTILTTTDIADANKIGSASNVVDGGDGKHGIMCYSEYLNALNGTAKPGDDNYEAYEKSVADYEAPAGIDTVTYQYMAKGETYDTADGQTEIQWTLLAWPAGQSLDGSVANRLTEAKIKEALDTPEEIASEWDKAKVTLKTGNDAVELNVPDAAETESLFYFGQPEWFSGNQGSFDSWDAENHYLMHAGLWSRLETGAIKVESVGGSSLSYKGTPSVSIALYQPSNSSEVYQGADIKAVLTESNDTAYLPLYAGMDSMSDPDASDKLETMKLSDILRGQSDVTKATLPTYNIRKQLHSMWETTRSRHLKNASSLTCRRINGGTIDAPNAELKTWSNIDVTGVRLYAIGSHVRIDTDYINANRDYVDASTEGGTIGADITAANKYNSAYQGDVPYGAIGNSYQPLMFVFNINDINPDEKIVHIDNIPGQVLNMSDVYASYDANLAKTGALVAEDAINTIVPFQIRSDAYYDVTEDYQRAAGVLYGRVDAPTIDTNAVNVISNGKFANPTTGDKIADTVTYTGLNAGSKYTLEGKIYKSTDTTFTTAVATATATFTAASSNGEQVVEFSFDSSSISAGEKLVVTEKLVDANSTVIATHEDLADADQTVTYQNGPILVTRASLSDENRQITDEVTYTGLEPSTDYVIATTAYDATMDKMLSGKEVNEFTSSNSGSGTVSVVFDEYDINGLYGHTVVIFESVSTKADPNVVVAEHNAKDDKLQTVVLESNIDIVTVAQSGTGSKYLDAIDSETIVDTVTVSNLKANTKYTARATLYDVTAGQMVTDASNNILSWTSEFTTGANGQGEATVTLSNFSASDKAGHTLVVYEDILNETGVAVGTHADNADEQQTVTVKAAGISTVLTDKNGNKDMASSSSMNFKDEIKYSGLVPGNRYYMVSTLVDKATGKVLNDTSGHQAVVTSTVFRANTTGTNAGSSTFTFSNMASTMSGKSVVAYNDLYRVIDDTAAESKVTKEVKAELVASERDLNNTNQTVVIDATIEITDPTLDTVAKGVDDSKTIPLATNSVIKDTVSYNGLTPGKTYTLTADVYDTNTGKRAVGYTKEQTMDFTASDEGKGEVIMTIDVNTMELSGHKLVVYETLALGDTTIAQHRDLTDADQTVTVNDEFQASIDTVATDRATGGKTLMASADAVILDKVSYDGLDTGMSYTLTTTVYDKATGSKCESIEPVTTTFTPEEEEGTIEVSIPVDGTKFTAGQSLVVYEELKTTSKTNGTNSKDNKTKTVTVATHKDISDADQTVTFVKMSTYLTGDGTSAKTVHVGSDAYVIDTASFTGLTPNRTYVITTQLLDVAASSGAVTLDTNTSANNTASGQAVASRIMEFTPTTANGSVATQINVNTTALHGHSLVAVATVTDKATGQTVATHMDKANVDQTITVQTRVEAQTGVSSMAWIFGLIALIMFSACASYGLGLYSDKRNNG